VPIFSVQCVDRSGGRSVVCTVQAESAAAVVRRLDAAGFDVGSVTISQTTWRESWQVRPIATAALALLMSTIVVLSFVETYSKDTPVILLAVGVLAAGAAVFGLLWARHSRRDRSGFLIDVSENESTALRDYLTACQSGTTPGFSRVIQAMLIFGCVGAVGMLWATILGDSHPGPGKGMGIIVPMFCLCQFAFSPTTDLFLSSARAAKTIRL
jgi:hypothetical protein